MNPRIKSLAMLLLLIMFLSAGVIKGSDKVATSPLDLLHKGAKSRKFLGFDDVVLDYDYAGPNGKHDPRGKKGGGGGKTP